MSQFSDDELLSQDSIMGYEPVPDTPLEPEDMPLYAKKLINASRSIQEKEQFLKDRTIQKLNSIEGYNEAVLDFSDADSGVIKDDNGNVLPFRLSSGSYNYLDATDFMNQKNKSSASLDSQAIQVSDLVGKPVEQLTEQDYINVKNYQLQELLKQSSPEHYEFTPYDNTTVYSPTPNAQAKFGYKVVGHEYNEDGTPRRALVEIVNPTTGKFVSFDMSNNPYLNARNSPDGFNMYASVDSQKNIKALAKYGRNKLLEGFNYSSALDTDSRTGEFIDLVQANVYRAASRVLQYGPDFLVNSNKWKAIANEETGQQLADAWAGVSQRTRDAYVSGMQEASDEWDNGEYGSAILGWAAQLDRVFADSAVQTGLIIAGSALTGGIVGAVGGTAAATSTAARVGGLFIGASLGSTDITLSMIEQYKSNNNGENPPPEEIASMWAINTALLMPEALMTGINIGKVLPKNVASKLNIAYQMKALPSRAKIIGASALEENIQEAFQESFETYGSQKGGMFNGERKFWSDILLDEGIKAGVIGGMAGGSLSLAVQGSTAPFAKRAENQRAKAVKVVNERLDEHTTSSTPSAPVKANKEYTDKLIEALDKSTVDDIPKLNRILNNAETATKVGSRGVRTIQKRRNELLLELAKTDENALSKYGVTKEEVFEEYVFHSDPAGVRTNAESVTNVKESSLKAVTEHLEQVGIKELGLPEEFVKKTIAQVSEEVRYGEKGYLTYKHNLDSINKKLKNPKLKPETRKELETAQRNNFASFAKLQNSQLSKLNSYVNALATLASGTNLSEEYKGKYASGKPFYIFKDDIRNGSFKKGTGAYGIINAVVEDLKHMDVFATELGLDSQIKKIDTLLGKMDVSISAIKKKADASPNVQKEATKYTSTDVENNITVLSRFGDMLDSGKKIGRLLNGFKVSKTKEELQAYVDYLAEHPNKSASKALSIIMEDKVEQTIREEKLEAKKQPIINTAKEGKKKYTRESIEAIKTIEELRTVSKEVKDIRDSLNTTVSDNTIGALLKHYEDLGEVIVKRSAELQEAKTEATTDSANKASKTENKEVGIDSPTKSIIVNSRAEDAAVDSVPEPSKPAIIPVEEASIAKDTAFVDKLKTIAFKRLKNLEDFSIGFSLKALERINKDGSINHSLISTSYEDKAIHIHPSEAVWNKTFKEKLLNKKWKRKDDSFSSEVAYEFNSLDELITFAIEHEVQHHFVHKKPNETLGQYEDRVNQAALESLGIIVKQEDTVNKTAEKTTKEVTEEPKVEKKDYAIMRVFDNRLANLSNDYNGVTPFKITRELRVGIPASKFGIHPVNKLISKGKLEQVFKDISFLAPIINSIEYLTKTSKEGTSLLRMAPALRLLFNLDGVETENGYVKAEGKRFLKANLTVAGALDFSVRELFSITDMYNDFNPMDKESINRTYGLNETNFKSWQKQQIKELSDDYGIPRAAMANKLGKLILSNLGVVRAKDEDGATKEFYEKLVTGLGIFALRYATHKGWITQSKFNVSKYERDNGISHFLGKKDISRLVEVNLDDDGSVMFDSVVEGEDTNIERDKEIAFIKITNKEVIQEVVEDFKENLSHLKEETDMRDGPTTKAAPFDADMKVKNTNHFMNIPFYTKRIMKKLFNVPYVLNVELAKQALNPDNRLAVEKHLGVLSDEEIALLPFEDQRGARGKNLAVRRDLDNLNEIYEKQKELANKSWFFKWFFAKNGRLYMDSNKVNPQTGKTLQRFFVLPIGAKRTVTLDPNTSMDEYYETEDFAQVAFAIAQAFDLLKSDKKIAETAKKIIKIPANELRQALFDFKLDGKTKLDFSTVKDVTIGLENFSHALNVIQHIEKFQKARDDKQPFFDTWLAVENDSTTNGYYIKMLQFPIPSIIKEFDSKVGILEEGYEHGWTEIHNLKDLEGFFALYETIATKVKVPTPYGDSVPGLIGTKAKTYITMFPALPKPDEDESGKVNITKALRTLFKDPTMLFSYAAGKASISEALADNISMEFIREYVKHINGQETSVSPEILIELFSHLETFNVTKDFETGRKIPLTEAFKTKYISQIKLKVDGEFISLDNYFKQVLAPSYGEAVWGALTTAFGPLLEYNATMNQMYIEMFKVFDIELEKGMDVLREKYPDGIPVLEEKALIESLINLMPIVRLPINNGEETLQSGMMIMGTAKEYDLNNKASSPYQEYQYDENGKVIRNKQGFPQSKLVQETNYANIRAYVDAGLSGAVVPIHFNDGMGITMLLEKYGDRIIPVHDAAVMSAYDNKEVTQSFNRNTFLLNKHYSIYNDTLKRYKEVMGIAKKEGIVKGTDSVILVLNGKKQKFTVDSFTRRVGKLNADNMGYREARFNGKKYYITNVDGITDSGVVIEGDETLDENRFMEGWETNRDLARDVFDEFYSDPNTFTLSGDIKTLQRNGLEDVNTRVKIFDRLLAMNNKPISKEYADYLRGLVRKVNSEPLMGISVRTGESTFNAGEYDPSTKTISIGFDNATDTELDSVTRLSPLSTKSAAEIYVHELIHAGLGFGLNNNEVFKFNKEIKQAMQIMKQVIETDLITWEDFMPEGNYAPSMAALYEQNAKKIYTYIFENPDNKKNLRGIHEFFAYSMTNAKVREKLSKQYIKNLNPTDKIKLLDRIVNIVMAILDVVRGKGKFNEVFATGHELLKGNYTIRQRNTLLNEIENLHKRINQANTKATNTLIGHPARILETLFKVFGTVLEKADKTVSKPLKYVANIADERGWSNKFSVPDYGTIFEYTKMYANILLLTPFSRKRRQMITTILSKAANISQQGALATIIRDVQEPDLDTSTLEQLAAYTRMVEGTSKGIEGTIIANLREEFNPGGKPENDLNEVQQQALTTVVLRTDLGSLLQFDDNHKVTNIDEILEYLNNPDKLQEDIKSLEQELATTKYGSYYNKQAFFLARDMVTGVGLENLNLNASNIAYGVGTGLTITPTKETIQTIDKLVTLKALALTDDVTKQAVAGLNKNGLTNLLMVQRQFVEESKEASIEHRGADSNTGKKDNGLLLSLHIIKGYTKAIFDSSLDTRIGRLKDREAMKQINYEFVKKISANDITGQNDLALYQRKWSVSRHREGSAFGLVGANPIGATLTDTAYEIHSQLPINEAAITDVHQLAEQFKMKAEKISRAITSAMLEGKLSNEEIIKMSEGYTPIASPTGGFSDYRITMSNRSKVEYMGMSEDAFTILGKMYASKNTKLSTPDRNKILTQFLQDDMKANLIKGTNMNKAGKNYILLEPDSDNPFLRDAYHLIPKELREAIKLYNEHADGFWVREEWLGQLFGMPTMSLIDNKQVQKYTNSLTKYSILLAEHILKHIAYMAKQNIVIRFPLVLMGNIISNINLSIAKGRNPTKVIKMQIQNAQNIRDYIDSKKALDRILFRQKLHTATDKELRLINWYETKLAHNPVRPLMEKGMYQAIVEDIDTNQIDNTGKINKWLTTIANHKRIPSTLRTVVKHLYMMEGTPFFDFMFQATQYSDFVARATEYQLQMEKAPAKFIKNTKGEQVYNKAYEKYEQLVSIDVWNAFINYDKPQSSLEQYLNDIGLVMFTKYFKRIQHMLFKNAINNPVSTALFLISQATIADTADIYESNVFSRGLLTSASAPWNNFISAAIPMPIQFLTDTGLFKK